MLDIEEEDMFVYIEEFIEFIEDNLSDTIYIHCDNGHSRSIAFLIAYLIWKYMITFNQAYDMIQTRKHVDLNPTFECSLLIFERWDRQSDLMRFRKDEIDKWRRFTKSIKII